MISPIRIGSLLLSGAIIFLFACRSSDHKGPHDTPTSGEINISVDESFEPVIREMIKTYTALYPNTRINATYKTEADCFRDFFRDSATRLVLVTRGLKEREDQFMRDSLGYGPGFQMIASDAVAVILHKNAPDSLMTIEYLQSVMSGSYKNKSVVFDGNRSTSTLRFIMDSIMKGKPLDTSVVRAASNSSGVIEYVGSHEEAIGLIGFSWIGNPEIPEQVESLKKVNLAYIRCEICEGKPWVKPVQENIINRRYPLTRDLYYLIRENFTGLGSGLAAFMKLEQGQLIFKRFYLRPVMDFQIRRVVVNKVDGTVK